VQAAVDFQSYRFEFDEQPHNPKFIINNIGTACAVRRQKRATLFVNDYECLKNNAGIRVRFTVSTGRFSIFQNIRVWAGGQYYEYSEMWSANTTKSIWDYFQIPLHCRGQRYRSIAVTWLEIQHPGDGREKYIVGRMDESNDGGTDPDTPWGEARGTWELRTVPAHTTPIRRETIIRWDTDGIMLEPIELMPVRRCTIGESQTSVAR
jgi:hypothetical protein